MNQPDLGILIADLRKKQGLTQEELVERCNINVRTIQRIEAGEVNPRSYTIKNILQALGTTLDDVFKEDNNVTVDLSNIKEQEPLVTENSSFKTFLLIGAVSGIIYLILYTILISASITYSFTYNRSLDGFTYILLSGICWVLMTLFYSALYNYGIKYIGKLFAYSCLAFIVVNAATTFSDVFYYTSDVDPSSWSTLWFTIPMTFIYGLGFTFIGIGLFVERKHKRELIKWAGITGIIGGFGFMTIILFPVGIIGTLIFEILLITILLSAKTTKKPLDH